jgi:SAM-dependent methyltransferase
VTSSDVWSAEAARRYDETYAELATPEALGPTLDLLVELAEGGRVLEFAIGTGRVAVPLAQRGVEVAGIELSAPMVDELRRKVDEATLPVVVGDMATARAPGTFSLVYLVFNTIGNLCTQQEQVACFQNAARHLRPGGAFVVEVGVPAMRRWPPGQAAIPFDVSERHVGFDTYDPVTQQALSHHYTHLPDGSIRHARSRFRYVWPSELDLMAQLAGLRFESRWDGWDRTSFTADSESHVSVWRRTETS